MILDKEMTVHNCKCGTESNVWSDDVVTDAYQLKGHNIYNVKCPNCGFTEKLHIPIEGFDDHPFIGQQFWSGFWSLVTGK